MKGDAVYCFPCRQFGSHASLDLTFTVKGCEKSFSTLKNMFTEHRGSMSYPGKAHLIQAAFEKDLTKKRKTEWKDSLLGKFHLSRKC